LIEIDLRYPWGFPSLWTRLARLRQFQCRDLTWLEMRMGSKCWGGELLALDCVSYLIIILLFLSYIKARITNNLRSNLKNFNSLSPVGQKFEEGFEYSSNINA
jgi:hypothetical protein